jgi:hypothetical protein
MVRLKRIAPAFPVRDVRVALAYYQRLGFTTREYTGAVGWISTPTVVYGFAVGRRRDPGRDRPRREGRSSRSGSRLMS